MTRYCPGSVRFPRTSTTIPTDRTASRFTSRGKDRSCSTWPVAFETMPFPSIRWPSATRLQFPVHPEYVSFRGTVATVHGGTWIASVGRIGSNGASTFAPSATTRNATSRPSPIQLIRPARVFRSSNRGWTIRPTIEWRGIHDSRRPFPGAPMALQPDSRVDDGSEDVDQEADQHDDRRVDDDDALDHRHVLRVDGFEEEAPHPVDRERLFCEDGARKEDGELQAEDRDHRDECVTERVTGHDLPLGDAARTCGLRVVGHHRPEHVGSHGLREEPAQDKAKGEAREDEVPDCDPEVTQVPFEEGVHRVHPGDGPRVVGALPPPVRRKPPQSDRKHQLEHQAEPQNRHDPNDRAV